MAASLIKIKLADLRYGGELPEGCPALQDGEVEPIIVEPIQGKNGTYYALVDGYHRLAGLVRGGAVEMTVLVPTSEEFCQCREFGGTEEDMNEADWIEWIQGQV